MKNRSDSFIQIMKICKNVEILQFPFIGIRRGNPGRGSFEDLARSLGRPLKGFGVLLMLASEGDYSAKNQYASLSECRSGEAPPGPI